MTAAAENNPTRTPDWWERRAGTRELDAAMAVGMVLAAWREQSMPRVQGARVGVVCDASASMADFSGVMATLAWAVITGLHHDDSTPVRSVVIRAGQTVERIGGIDHRPAVIGPRVCPWDRPVPEVAAGDKYACLNWGVELADDFANLHSRGPARLLILITSANQTLRTLDRTCTYLNLLQRTGCQVLWVCPRTARFVSTTFPGARLHLLNPGDFARTPGSTARAWHAFCCLGASVLDALTASTDT